MTGHRPFRELTAGFTPDRRARVAERAARMQEEMTLDALRIARGRSQEAVAEALEIGQPAIAKLERRRDMHVSTLRRYVEALGGELELRAKFGDVTVSIIEDGGR